MASTDGLADSEKTGELPVNGSGGAEAKPEGDTMEPEYPTGIKYWTVVFAFCIVIFLITMDGTIIATAVPVITNEFNSLKDIGWYSSVYYMGMCISQLLYGKLGARYPIQWTYGAAMLLFLVGSALRGAAPNSPALIVGRLLAGFGCAGLLVATFSLVPVLAPPLKRPMFVGAIGASLGLGTALGPLIGGAFTERVTWRWCFYINLPVGAFSWAVFVLFVRPLKRPSQNFTSWADLLENLDLIGMAALAPSIICLLLALQWGGSEYPWSDGRIIALLVLFGVLGVAFIGIEYWQDDRAMLPARVLAQRSIIGASLFTFCTAGPYFLLAYYIPIWFQAAKEHTPLQAGVDTLPMVLGNTVFSVMLGFLVPLVGYVWPFITASSVLGSIGVGLLTTFTINTNTSKWIGFLVLYGFSVGWCAQTPLIVAQNVLPLEDVPIGSAVVMFMQTFSGAIWISVVQALVINNLSSGLAGLGFEDFDFATVLAGGFSSITEGLSGSAKTDVLNVMNNSLTHSWRLPLALVCIGILGALLVEHRRIRGKEKGVETSGDSQITESNGSQ